MIEKTSLDATGETFLCPYCQTWLDLPLSLKAKHLAELVGWKRAHDDVAAENHRICQTLDKLRIKHLAVMLEKNAEIAALLKGRKSIIQFMKTEYEKELAKKNKEIATLKKEESMPAPERFLSDEGMNVYDAAIKVIGELKAEIAALLKGRKSIIQFMKTEHEKELTKKAEEIARLKRRLTNVLDVVSPMASGSQKDEIAALTAELQQAQGSYADGVGESRLEEQDLRKEIATLTEKYLRAGAIAERFKEVTQGLTQEINRLKGKYNKERDYQTEMNELESYPGTNKETQRKQAKQGKYPPIPDDFVEDKP